LQDAELTVTVVSSVDLARACGAFADAVSEGKLIHPPDPELDGAVYSARKRPRADAFVFGRAKSLADITPLYAVTLAHWVAAEALANNYDVLASFY